MCGSVGHFQHEMTNPYMCLLPFEWCNQHFTFPAGCCHNFPIGSVPDPFQHGHLQSLIDNKTLH